MWDISLEKFQWGLQLFFNLTSIRCLHKKLWASKVAGVSISGILGFLTWGFEDKMTFGCWPRGQVQCEFMFVYSSFVQQKCSNYALINLLYGFCRSIWVIDPLVTHPNPIPELEHAPLPSKCCEPGNTPQLLFLPLFSPLESQSNPSRSLGVHQRSWHRWFVLLQKIDFKVVYKSG